MGKATLSTFFSTILLLGLMLTACSSDDSTPEPPTQEANRTYFLTVNASKWMDTRALNDNGNKLDATWAIEEKIYVGDGNNWYDGFLQPTDGGKIETSLQGTITVPASAGEIQNLTFLFPSKEMDYTGQVGTLEDIAEKYDYAEATANGVYTDGDKIEVHSAVKFYEQQAIVKFTLQYSDANTKTSSLRISATNLKSSGDNTGDITINPTTATNEVFAALSGIDDAQVTLTAQANDGKTYIYKKSGVTFTNGVYKRVTVNMKELTYPKNLTEITDDYIGSVVGSDGTVYRDASTATAAGTTAVAMIAYVGNDITDVKGLAIALADEEGGYMSEDGAKNAIKTKNDNRSDALKNSGAEWKLPSVNEWKYMFIGCGNGANISETTVNYTCFNAKLASTGGNSFSDGSYYWSDEFINSKFEKSTAIPNYGQNLLSCYVRACLAF